MTEGQPVNWNFNNAYQTGILSNDSLDMNKILELKKIDYYKTKIMFGISADYFIVFKNQDSNYINLNGSYGIGHNQVNVTQTTINFDSLMPKDLSQLSRITIYDRDLIRVEIYVWQ